MRTPLRLCCLVGLSLASAAAAHGSLPNSHQATVRIGTPGELWVETTFGLVVSQDSGAHWDWICEEAAGYSGHAALRVAQSGRIFAAASDGLYVSDDHGCTWSANPLFSDLGLTDVWLTGTDPELVYLTTARYQSTNGLFRSTNGGNTFQQTPLKSDTLLFSGVRTAPSNPARVYVSAWWYVDVKTMKLFRSDDGAASFTEIDLSSLPNGPGTFTVWAVHPTNPDVLFASMTQTSGQGHTFILRSTDGGATFSPVLDTPAAVNAIELSPDGQSVWVGTVDGLLRSTDGGATFSELPSPQKNACAVLGGSTLFACGSQLKDGFALGRSDDLGTTITPALKLSGIRGPVECPAGTSTHDVCGGIWPAVQSSFPSDAPPDAGPGSDGGPENPPPTGCGCGASPGAAVWLGGLIALALGRRRRAGGAPG